MKFSVNMLIQIVSMASQAANAYGGMFPPQFQTKIAIVLGVAQAVTAGFASWSNPDGTKAKTPYIAPGTGTIQ